MLTLLLLINYQQDAVSLSWGCGQIYPMRPFFFSALRPHNETNRKELDNFHGDEENRNCGGAIVPLPRCSEAQGFKIEFRPTKIKH